MKMVKVFFLIILTGAAGYLMFTQLPKTITENAEFKTKVLVESLALQQQQKVAKGIFEKSNIILGISKTAATKTLDELKGTFEGYLTSFVSMKYYADTKDTVPKVEVKTDKKIADAYLIRQDVGRGYIEAAVDLQAMVDKAVLPNIKFYQKIPPKKLDPKIIRHVVEIGETGWSLEAAMDVKPDLKMMQIAAGLVILLGLSGIVFTVLQNGGGASFGSLITLAEQIKAGNDDLRFELYDKDTMYHQKELINEFLDYVFDRIHAGEESVKTSRSLMQAVSNSVRDSILKKQLHYYTGALQSYFGLTQYHIFMKDDKDILYINTEGEMTVENSESVRIDEFLGSESKAITESIDIMSFVGKESGTLDSYILLPLQDFGFVAIPKELYDTIDSNQFEMFTASMSNIMKSGTDKMTTLREKVLFEKLFARLPAAVLWVDKNGAVKRSNAEFQRLFALNEDVTGTMVGKFFHMLNIDFSPVAQTLNSQTNQQATADVYVSGVVKHVSYLTAVLPVSNSGEFETIIMFTETQEGATDQVNELYSIIEKKTQEITALQSANAQLTTVTESQKNVRGEDTALSNLVAVLSQAIVRGAKLVNSLIEKAFDEDEKRYLDAVRKELLHLNFSVKNYLLTDAPVMLENRDESDFTMVLKRAFETFKTDYGKKKIGLSVQLEKDLGVYPFDKTYIGMALYNIFKVSHDVLNQEGFMTITARKTSDRLGFSVMLKNCVSRSYNYKDRADLRDYIDVYLYVVNKIIQKHNGETSVTVQDGAITIAILF